MEFSTTRHPNPQQPELPLGLLAVSADARDVEILQKILDPSRWRVFRAVSLRQAAHILHHDDVSLVLCDQILPDGSWKMILHELRHLNPVPALIVASTLADDALWAEVLNLGAYDLLAKPFRSEEVLRTIGAAPRLQLAASA